MANVSEFLPNISLVESGGNYTLNIVVSLPAPYEITSVNWEDSSRSFEGSPCPCGCPASEIREVTVTVNNTGTGSGLFQEQGSVPMGSYTAIQVAVEDASAGDEVKGTAAQSYDQAYI